MHNFLSILFKTFQLMILQYHFARFSCLNTFFGTFLGKGTFFNNLSERAKRVFLDSKVKFVCIMYQRNDWDKKISQKQFFHFFHDIILTQCPTCLYCVSLILFLFSWWESNEWSGSTPPTRRLSLRSRIKNTTHKLLYVFKYHY